MDVAASRSKLRVAHLLVVVPRVVLSAVLWLMLIEAAHGIVAWAILTVLVIGMILSVVDESFMVRMLWWAQPTSSGVCNPVDPRVRVLTTTRRSPGIESAGRAHLVVPAGWVGLPAFVQLLEVASRRQQVAAGRFEVLYTWFTIVWRVPATFVNGFGHGVTRLSIFGFAWRVRLVITSIAVWQTVMAGQYVSAAWIVIMIGLTYLLPWTHTNEAHLVAQALGDQTSRVTAAVPIGVDKPAVSHPSHHRLDPSAAGHLHRWNRAVANKSRRLRG